MCYDDDTAVSVLGWMTGGIGGRNNDLSFCAIDEMSLSITSYCLTVWANFIAPVQGKKNGEVWYYFHFFLSMYTFISNKWTVSCCLWQIKYQDNW